MGVFYLFTKKTRVAWRIKSHYCLFVFQHITVLPLSKRGNTTVYISGRVIPNEVEVIVSDNASSDKTPEILSFTHHSCFRAYRNEENRIQWKLEIVDR